MASTSSSSRLRHGSHAPPATESVSYSEDVWDINAPVPETPEYAERFQVLAHADGSAAAISGGKLDVVLTNLVRKMIEGTVRTPNPFDFPEFTGYHDTLQRYEQAVHPGIVLSELTDPDPRGLLDASLHAVVVEGIVVFRVPIRSVVRSGTQGGDKRPRAGGSVGVR